MAMVVVVMVVVAVGLVLVLLTVTLNGIMLMMVMITTMRLPAIDLIAAVLLVVVTCSKCSASRPDYLKTLVCRAGGLRGQAQEGSD